MRTRDQILHDATKLNSEIIGSDSAAAMIAKSTRAMACATLLVVELLLDIRELVGVRTYEVRP